MSSTRAKQQKNDPRTVQSINPATGSVIETFTAHTRSEAEEVIHSAHKAFNQWKNESINDRVQVIQKIGQTLNKNKEELAKMMTEQMGKPIAQSRSEVDLCVAICEYTAKSGPDFLKEETRPIEEGTGTIIYQPLGVILAMQPWNFPLYQVVRYSIPNLLAGNTTVLKHSELCWGTAKRIQELYESAGLPKGAFGVICVDNETADELVNNPLIKGVTLTGSAKAGRLVAEKAGAALKKVVLELGGSDPYIILDDVKLDQVIETCVKGRINNGGQTCIAAKRFIVLDGIYDEFKDKFVDAMAKVSYGDPMDEDNDMGPMSSKDAQQKLHKQVQTAIKKGAKCLVGGKLPEGEGCYYPATVLENPQPGSPAYDDELFGPVASLFRVKNEEDALRLANDHAYGLGGGVFSADIKRAEKLARRIETGMVNINGYALAQPNMPFGGVKDSGYGREHGGFGIREFVNAKAIMTSK